MRIILTLFVSLFMITTNAVGGTTSDIEAFYDHPKNVENLENLKTSGQLEKLKGILLSRCELQKDKIESNPNYCDCTKAFLSKLSDREYHYLSILETNHYMERREVLRDKGEAALKELQERQKKSTLWESVLKRLVRASSGRRSNLKAMLLLPGRRVIFRLLMLA